MLSDFMTSYPELLAVLIAASGFVVAALLARLTERALIKVDAYMGRSAAHSDDGFDLNLMLPVFRSTIYYGTLLSFLLFALHTLSISVVKEWLALLLQYIPQLILSGLIILSGYLISVVVRSLVAGLMGVQTEHLLPRFSQALVVVAAVLTGLAQTAIDISFITDVMVILVAFFFGGLSLAFALGSRQLVENLLARRALERYRIGDRVRVGETEGRIIEILSSAVLLEAEKGVLSIPTSRFIDAEVLLISEEVSDDSTS